MTEGLNIKSEECRRRFLTPQLHLCLDLNEVEDVVQENMEVEPAAVAANQEEEAPGPSQSTSSTLDLDEEQAGEERRVSLTHCYSFSPPLSVSWSLTRSSFLTRFSSLTPLSHTILLSNTLLLCHTSSSSHPPPLPPPLGPSGVQSAVKKQPVMVSDSDSEEEEEPDRPMGGAQSGLAYQEPSEKVPPPEELGRLSSKSQNLPNPPRTSTSLI